MMGLVALATWTADAGAACDPATQYTYTFTSACAEPIWIGQRSTGDPAAYPSEAGSWALSSYCTTNADCPSDLCDVDSGQCTCSTASDCPGGAPCGADDKCMRSATFCMPQSWNSGTFWPRTGCTPNGNQLACETGACFDTGGTPLLDCSVSNGGGSPTNPVTQFEVTSTSASVNYDVSLAAGYNVEIGATPVGGGQVVPGTTNTVACYPVGCTSDLNATCPSALQVTSGGAVIGCLDPCTRCQRPDPSPSLQCLADVGETWTCGLNSGPVTTQDLYCAKNFFDGAAQASPNQGTPTAFSQLDCPPGTTFKVPTFSPDYALPAGQGVCLWTSPPQSTIAGFNDYSWDDAGSGTTTFCTTTPDGEEPAACGGYLTPKANYPGALGYTCRDAHYTDDAGAAQVAHLCMPPVATGLGTCASGSPGVSLYSSGAGVANQSWLDVATLAGGGTPYYETFKTACQAAYAWQYDDISSGFSCTVASEASGGSTFTGFAVTLCGSRVPGGGGGGNGGGGGGGGGGTPTDVVALQVRGRAARLGRANRGLLRIKARTTLPTSVSLEDLAVTVNDLLDQVGAAGELVSSADVTLSPRRRKKKVAIFQSDGGDPRVKVVVHRPRPDKENVKVIVIARRATIAKPTCDGDSTSIETSLDFVSGTDLVQAGTIGTWRCKREALKAE